MNTKLLKAKMAEFFSQVSTDYLIDKYQQMGYTFEETCVKWDCVRPYADMSAVTRSYESIGWFRRIILRSKPAPQKKLTSEYPGSFFFINLVP